MRKPITACIFVSILFVSLVTAANPAFADNSDTAGSSWKKLQPVRELWQKRDYQGARDKLTHIARVNNMDGIGIEISTLKNLLKKVKGVVDEGYSSLKIKRGRTYPVPLKEGGKLEGKVKRVDDDKIVLEYKDTEHAIALNQIDIDRIIRLSVLEYSPDAPENQALFAVLYSMEGDLQKARETLQSATESGYNATAERSFVNWVTNIQESQMEEEGKKVDGKKDKEDETHSPSSNGGETVKKIHDGENEIVVLIDRIHGRNMPDTIRRKLEKHKVKVKYANGGSYSDGELEKASVIIIQDKARGSISRDDARKLAQFVRDGGGLVYFGSTGKADPALQPFLKALKIKVRTDKLTVNPNAPESIPKNRALAGASGKHPVTSNSGPIFFPLNACTINTSRKKAFLISSKQLKSKISDESPVILGAVFTLGGGKIVAFGALPNLYDRQTKESARRIVLNAVAYANR